MLITMLVGLIVFSIALNVICIFNVYRLYQNQQYIDKSFIKLNENINILDKDIQDLHSYGSRKFYH